MDEQLYLVRELERYQAEAERAATTAAVDAERPGESSGERIGEAEGLQA